MSRPKIVKTSEEKFKTLAQHCKNNDGPYSWGYHRGLRRAHHGERYEPELHEQTLGLADDDERRRGYLDGLAARDYAPTTGRPPMPSDQVPRVRSVRLNDARYEKFQRLGREWLERMIDEADEPGDG